MQLVGTPLSHFTRKVRIVCAELGIEVELVRPPGVLVAGTAAYGDNPLRRVPTLIDGELHLFESDHIVRYLVARHDPSDRLGVTSVDADALNRLAAINGVMANEVTLILSKRAGGVNMDAPYFTKLLGSIASTLDWLDARTQVEAPAFNYRDIALVCMWQHLVHYGLLPLEDYTRVAARVALFADRPSVLSTTPERSLADAKAAGWSPG